MIRRPRVPLLLLLTALLLSAPLFAQLGKARGSTAVAGPGDGPKLVSSGDDPVIRIPVAHQHAASGCGGYLYVSRHTIKYEVVTPERDKSHSFELNRSDLLVAQQWRFWGSSLPEAEFKFRNGSTYHFFHVRQAMLENNPNAKFSWNDVLPYEPLIQLVTQFDDLAAMLQAKEKPKQDVSPPVISLLEPAGADAGKTVPGSGSLLRVHGIATHQNGIASIQVNGRTAYVKPLAPSTVEFDMPDVAIKPGVNPVLVVATSSANTTSQLMFTVSVPEAPTTGSLHLSTRPAGAQVYLDGAAMGTTGPQDGVLTLPALKSGDHTLRVTLAGYKEWTQPLVITPGNQLSLDAALQPEGPAPFSAQDIVDMLRGGISSRRATTLVQQRGVAFSLDDSSEKAIRDAGGGNDLLLEIAKSKR